MYFVFRYDEIVNADWFVVASASWLRSSHTMAGYCAPAPLSRVRALTKPTLLFSLETHTLMPIYLQRN